MNAPPVELLFVISPESLLLDIAGPAEAFRLANLHRVRGGLEPCFRLRFASHTPQTLTSVGLPLADLEPLPQTLSPRTWVVLVGQPSARVNEVTQPVIATAQWLARTLRDHLHSNDTPHRLVTICSGALLAARAGLLDNRQCTTHHELLGVLRKLAPRALVVDDCVFLVDGAVASSAGITAGIDLALHLVADVCGEALAVSVAKDMVMYLRRAPRDPELSPFLAHRRHTHTAVHKVQDAICAEPERAWDMAGMAALGHVTARHLLRLFLQHAGLSPMHYLQSIRLERARQSLEHGASVTRAAELAGFGSGLHLRRAWHRQWGGSPRDADMSSHAPPPGLSRLSSLQPGRARVATPRAAAKNSPG